MPVIVTKTPVRISFAGGATDLAQFYRRDYGSVVAAAINKYVYVVVKEREDSHIRVMHSETQTAQSVDLVEDDLIRLAMQKTGVSSGVEIAVMGHVGTQYTGLGAHSALTVGLLNALHAHKGDFVSAEVLAKEACELEINMMRQPIGKQNQYSAAYGGLRHFLFFQDESVKTNKIELNSNHKTRLLESLLLFRLHMDTEQELIMTEQIKQTSKNQSTLLAMRNQADDLAKYLNVGAVASLGQTLREGWNWKKSLASKISNPEIDSIVETATQAGAIGVKVTGAGGGGFLLVCVPPEKRNSVKQKLSKMREVPIKLSEHGSRIIFNAK